MTPPIPAARLFRFTPHPPTLLMAKFLSLILIGFALAFPLSAGAGVGEADLDAPDSAVVPQALASEEPTTPARVLTLDLTRDANDIWDRIRRGFGMPDLDSELVAEQQLFYLNRPSFLKQVFTRGGRYLYYIVDELERRGMPTEIALLPMVESSYNPLAYSRAHASGLWQFIPSTGKTYNLTQDKWVDERRDVIASTNAALDYLQTIYQMHGDWHLALASYNWGEGSVGRAVQRNLGAGLPTEYSALRMPEETRNYVPKLQALKNIVAQPELFHLELPYVPNEVHFVTVTSPVGIDLATAAKLADLPLEEFLALNPGFNRPVVTTPNQTLVIPADRAARFETAAAELALAGQGWRTYTLTAGEKLDAVARRHNLSVAQLQQVNGLSARSKIGPGYTLLVPDGVDPSGALQATRLLPNNGLLATQPGIRLASVKDDPPAKKTASKTNAKKTKTAANKKETNKKGAEKAVTDKKAASKKTTSQTAAKQTGSASARQTSPTGATAKQSVSKQKNR